MHLLVLHLRQTLRLFFLDFLDRSAEPKAGNSSADLWAITIAALSGLAQALDYLLKIVTQLFTAPVALVPALALVLGVTWSLFIIVAKASVEIIMPLSEPPQKRVVVRYAYAKAARLVAKILLIVMIILLPRTYRNTKDALIPLPDRLFGYIYEAKTGIPVSDARVRIVDSEGVDLTRGNSLTDSRGFYDVSTTKRVSRTSWLRVYRTECLGGHSDLPLGHQFEVQTDPQGAVLPEELFPVFYHSLDCKEKQ